MSEATLHVSVARSLTPSCLCSLTVGAAVRLTGSWVASPGSAQSHELHVRRVEVLGPSDAKVCSSRLS